MSSPRPDLVDVVCGDCIETMRSMPDDFVTAVVTDPPYGIGFMGKEWDNFIPAKLTENVRMHDRKTTTAPDGSSGRGITTPSASRAEVAGKYDRSSRANRKFQAWVEEWASETLRILKPGGHVLVFGGTRTYHRLACGFEDAGYEIRDCLMWLHSRGFPKSLDVSKAIDKAAGVAPTVVGQRRVTGTARIVGGQGGATSGRADAMYATHEVRDSIDVTEPTSETARMWQGYGTALKPAWEPILIARKPLVGTVAANCLEHGTGALNIDGCRIGPGGRWPANVILDEEAAALLDEQTGTLTSGKVTKTYEATEEASVALGKKRRNLSPDKVYSDSGGASRFFYCAKASKKDRGPGNTHPTVKPVELMRWLVRLVSGPDALILDPFAGSGTTGVACALEGTPAILIEREAEYVEIIHKRLRAARD